MASIAGLINRIAKPIRGLRKRWRRAAENKAARAKKLAAREAEKAERRVHK